MSEPVTSTDLEFVLDLLRLQILAAIDSRCPFCGENVGRESSFVVAARKGLVGQALFEQTKKLDAELIASGVDPSSFHKTTCERQAAADRVKALMAQ